MLSKPQNKEWTGQIINNSAIQMDIKPKYNVSHNVEDTYSTIKRKDHIDIDDIPETCDVKESLINKLQELDNKIYHLTRSNKYFEEEMQDPEN